MSELRSAIDEFESESLAEMPDARVEEDFGELHRAIERLELQRLRRLAEIERRRLHERDGHLSAAGWLAAVHRVPWGRARADLQTARSLGSMPLTRRALIDGEISFGAVRLLVEARRGEPEAFARAEKELVRAAGVHSTSELQKVVTFWRQRAERERGIDPEERQREQRNFHASVTWAGWSVSTATSIRRPESRCSPRWTRSSTPKRSRGKAIPAPPRSAEPTRSTRSVEAGSTPRIARASVESDLTSRSRSQRNNSRAARSGCSTMQESSRERRPSGSLVTRRSAGS